MYLYCTVYLIPPDVISYCLGWLQCPQLDNNYTWNITNGVVMVQHKLFETEVMEVLEC